MRWRLIHRPAGKRSAAERGCEQGRYAGGADVRASECQREWLLRLEEPGSMPAPTG